MQWADYADSLGSRIDRTAEYMVERCLVLRYGYPLFISAAWAGYAGAAHCAAHHFCGAYIVLLIVNAVFALVDGYQRRPPRLVVSRRMMTLISCVVALLICGGLLYSIDGRNT
jgi:hypothetical protein